MTDAPQTLETLVVNRYPKEKYNLLIPYSSVIVLSPFHSVRYHEIELDPEGGDAYKIRKTGEEWGLAKVALFKLASAAGIRFRSPTRTDDRQNRYYVSYHIDGEIQQLDGTWRDIYGDKDINLEDLKDVLVGKKAKYAPPPHNQDWDKACAWAWREVSDEWYQKLQFKNELCATGAIDRAIRMALPIKSNYTLAELKRPFVLVQVYVDSDKIKLFPELHQAYRLSAQASIALLYGDNDIPPAQDVAAAEGLIALTEGRVIDQDTGEIKSHTVEVTLPNVTATIEKPKQEPARAAEQPKPADKPQPKPQPKPTDKPEPPKCTECHKPIGQVKTKDRSYTPEQWAEATANSDKFKRSLCYACCTKNNVQQEAKPEPPKPPAVAEQPKTEPPAQPTGDPVVDFFMPGGGAEQAVQSLRAQGNSISEWNKLRKVADPRQRLEAKRKYFETLWQQAKAKGIDPLPLKWPCSEQNLDSRIEEVMDTLNDQPTLGDDF